METKNKTQGWGRWILVGVITIFAIAGIIVTAMDMGKKKHEEGNKGIDGGEARSTLELEEQKQNKVVENGTVSMPEANKEDGKELPKSGVDVWAGLGGSLALGVIAYMAALSVMDAYRKKVAIKNGA